MSLTDHDDSNCISCQGELEEDDELLMCAKCHLYSHETCCPEPVPKLRSKKQAWQKVWRCPNCQEQKSGTGTLDALPQHQRDIWNLLTDINAKLETLLPLRETVAGIEEFQKLLSDKYDETLKQLAHQDKELKTVKKRLDAVEKTDASREVIQLRAEIDELEWRSRNQNLIIHAIQQSEGEDLLSKVNEVAAKLEVPALHTCDVVALHRLPAKPGSVPGTIVRFAQQVTRDTWLQNKSKLKSPGTDWFIVENLTRRNRLLLSAARDWTRDHDYQYAWHKAGHVYVRRRSGEERQLIKCEADLSRLAV